MAKTPPFEVPQNMRELGEKNIEQGRAAYTQFMDAMMQASSMWMGGMPGSAVHSGKATTMISSVEIPKQLQDLADRNIEQSRAAYNQFMQAMEQAASMWMGGMPGDVASQFKIVQERGLRFSKQNVEAGFALASELAHAKDVQDALGIQTRYAQTQMQAYALQAQELSRLTMEALQGMQSGR